MLVSAPVVDPVKGPPPPALGREMLVALGQVAEQAGDLLIVVGLEVEADEHCHSKSLSPPSRRPRNRGSPVVSTVYVRALPVVKTLPHRNTAAQARATARPLMPHHVELAPNRLGLAAFATLTKQT